ncbi:MAG: hypothetical protein ABIT01_09805 [Thermoanaerobaculia bacterium]
MGQSGKGKSTLAAHLSRPRGRGTWPLISDDVLAVSLGEGLVLRDAFPDSDRAHSAERLPLRAIYVLRKWEREGIAVQALPQREAFLALSRHSVATRLLDAPLRRAHFEGCVSASRTVPVYELTYQRRISALDEIRTLLEASLTP